jgi:hypothetical protein
MLKGLLLYRFLIFNLCMWAATIFATLQGWMPMIYAGDASGISYIISALFLVVLASSFRQAHKISKDKDAVKAGTSTSLDGRKRLSKITHIDKAAEMMSLLGIIGTIVGFIIAFHGLDASALIGAESVGQNIAQLMTGMGVALYTTLIGALAGGWTEINYHILKTSAEILTEDESNDR